MELFPYHLLVSHYFWRSNNFDSCSFSCELLFPFSGNFRLLWDNDLSQYGSFWISGWALCGLFNMEIYFVFHFLSIFFHFFFFHNFFSSISLCCCWFFLECLNYRWWRPQTSSLSISSFLSFSNLLFNCPTRLPKLIFHTSHGMVKNLPTTFFIPFINKHYIKVIKFYPEVTCKSNCLSFAFNQEK